MNYTMWKRCLKRFFWLGLVVFGSGLFTSGAMAGKSKLPEAQPISAAFSQVWLDSIQLESGGQFQQALDRLDSSKAPPNWQAQWHVRRAWLLLQMQHYQASYSAYRKALDLSPNFVDALTGILVPLEAMNRWQEVYARSVSLVEQYPSLYAAHYHLCLAEQNSKNWSALLRRTQLALSLYPMSADFMVFQARGLDRNGDVSEAIEQYSKLLLVVPANQEALAYIQTYAIAK